MSPRDAVELRVPPSKSGTHRAFILGALSQVSCLVRHPLWGADCRSTLAVLEALGARTERVADGVRFRPVDGLVAAEDPLDCGNSGTTLRLLTGLVSALDQPVTLTGDASLCSRPNGALLRALETLGVHTRSQQGRAPVRIHGPLQAGHVALPAQVSSQYATALLLALSMVDGPSTLRMAAPVASRPYLAITRAVATAFGLCWSMDEDAEGITFHMPGGQRPSAAQYTVDGDWSGAAFPLVAASVSGRPVALDGLRPDDPQGDRAIVSILGAFGQAAEWHGDQLCLDPRPLTAGGTIELGATPDLFPALAALAAVAPGTTALVGAPSLRHKESDRIEAMADALTCLGVSVVQRPDGLVVQGGGLCGGQVDSLHDHRIYMALRVLSLVCPDIVVRGAGCEAVSYPDFELHLARFAGLTGTEPRS